MGNFYLYMHVNKKNGKRYIGITSTSPCQRWKRGSGYSGQRRFYSAIKHYGWDGFEHLILEDGLTKKEAERKEEETIKKYKSNDPRYGYNIENGGVIHKLSEPQKENLRQINLGRKASEETRKKMSESAKRVPHDWLNGIHVSESTRRKHSEHITGAKNPRAKAVYQYDLQGNLIARHEYMQKAVEAIGAKSSAHISQCCNGKRGQAFGFMWSYDLEELKLYERLWKGGHIHA